MRGDSNLADIALVMATVNTIVPRYEIAILEISMKVPERLAVHLDI